MFCQHVCRFYHVIPFFLCSLISLFSASLCISVWPSHHHLSDLLFICLSLHWLSYLHPSIHSLHISLCRLFHLSDLLSICLSVCLSVCFCFCMPEAPVCFFFRTSFRFICLLVWSANLSVCLSVCLSICVCLTLSSPFTRLPICLYVRLFTCLLYVFRLFMCAAPLRRLSLLNGINKFHPFCEILLNPKYFSV